MNALAHALAHATPTAMCADSDVAKTREEKGREGKGPHHTTPQGNWVAESQDQRLTQLRAASLFGLGGSS